jgi:mono/diheme cytochrome c family protein
MKTVRALIVCLALIAAAGLLFALSGLYDVAADTEHTGPVEWVLRTTQSRSVHRRAGEVRPPAWLARPDPAVLRTGLVHYHEMCVTCHGAPGVDLSEIAQGLNPPPPELSQEAEEPEELFWVTKHGIKMTGMPAFGVTHDDEEIWAIVAFLQQMPRMTKEQYQARLVAAGLAPKPAAPAQETAPPSGHTHAPGHAHAPGHTHTPD